MIQEEHNINEEEIEEIDYRKECLFDKEYEEDYIGEFIVSLANKITATRKKKKLTQRQLANKANSKQSTICRIERRLSDPTIHTILKIFKALEIELVIRDYDKNLSFLGDIVQKLAESKKVSKAEYKKIDELENIATIREKVIIKMIRKW